MRSLKYTFLVVFVSVLCLLPVSVYGLEPEWTYYESSLYDYKGWAKAHFQFNIATDSDVDTLNMFGDVRPEIANKFLEMLASDIQAEYPNKLSRLPKLRIDSDF